MKVVMSVILTASFWLCGGVAAALFQDICPYQECTCAEAEIICVDRAFQRIPHLIGAGFGGYTSLNLGTNNITQVPAGSLPPDLKEIIISLNPISTIDDSAFNSSATTLEALSFANARFTQIPTALLHIKALKSLTLRDTNILDWNEDVLSHAGQTLESLDLENVGFKVWPAWIQYFSHLTALRISVSSISSIPDNALDSLTNSLTSLSLFSNRLTVLPKSLAKLTSLQVLHVHQNRITDVAWLPLSSNVSSLYLHNNSLADAKQLSDSLRHFADSLSDLTIHDNQLRAFPNVTFLTHVYSLDFSNNQIADPYSGPVPITLYTIEMAHNSLPSIPYFMSTLDYAFEMYLSWNSIRQIHGTDFSKTITGVYLGHNFISELTDTSFPTNSNIATLRLNNNPIVKISSLAFINLPRLMDLNLQSTKLTRLPLTLSSLTSLRLIDFTGSTNLVCTCLEKSLGPWIVSLQQDGVSGDCGRTSIYNFFLRLSPECPEQM